MNERINSLLQFYIKDKVHHQYRQPEIENVYFLAKQFQDMGLPDVKRSVLRLRWVLENETPVVFPEAKIILMRTVTTVPEIFTKDEWNEIKKTHYIHELGKVCNINPDYMKIIDLGFAKKRKEIEGILDSNKGAANEAEYLQAVLETLDIIEAFAHKYAKAAQSAGNIKMAEILMKIPNQKPDNFHEALQFFRLMHYCLWCSFNYHNTIGRFDQYMYPYLLRDLKSGVLTREEAQELIEEFFISFNIDSDLYPGMQQGDNGQSMVLGGKDQWGKELYNELSDMCMKASLELKLIDPKINVRVHSQTSLELYEFGTQLTRQGLGFPQYCNDEIIIPALLRWGYEIEDAYNYVVAACWEVIVPGCGMDIPNIDGLSFAQVVVECLPKLAMCTDFNQFLDFVKIEIQKSLRQIRAKHRNLYMEPSTVMSLMMDGCIENGRDISRGNKYQNFGIHGSGISTAADSLAAIKKYVFEEGSISAAELQKALDSNFAGYDRIRNKLRFDAPKMGNNDDYVDQLAVWLLENFANSLAGVKNESGGIYRPGTGTAMYYIWHSKKLKATPDGREAGEELPCNYSPGLFTRCNGPVSIIKSFSKANLMKVANGGPLTIELDNSLFRNRDSTRKVAMFIKSFLDMGGHQIQINAVNREKLLDARRHPENHRNLIVRVWGWSGYFVELDEVYQEQILKRMELTIE